MASASNCKTKAMLMLMVAMLQLCMLATTTAGSAEAAPHRVSCPELPLVYPYWSMCTSPALYYGEELYEFRSVGSEGAASYLAPEWDESNSTYYVRLSDEGAKYRFNHISREIRQFVSQEDDVLIENADTGRALAWRQEGEGEYFLVETDQSPSDRFQFSERQDVTLLCPRVLGVMCQAYDILVYLNSTGLAAYSEEEVIYFKLSSEDHLPLVLVRSSDTSIQSQRRQAGIKSVLA